MRIPLPLEHTKRNPPRQCAQQAATKRLAAEAEGNPGGGYALTVSGRQSDRHTENNDPDAVIEQALARENGLKRPRQPQTL